MPSRRPHSKSRHGCTSCKKAHIKCDMGQPKCSHCTRTGKTCEYRLIHPMKMQGISSPTASKEHVNGAVLGHGSLPTRGPPADWRLSANTYPSPSSTASYSSATLGAHDFNIEDLLYLHHFTTCTFKSMVRDESTWYVWQEVVPKLARSQPYVMNLVLSFTALHLVALEPEASHVHRLAAEKHREIGLSLVKSAMADINNDNCDALWASSILLAVSSFAYYQAKASDNPSRLEQVINILTLTRGIPVVLEAAKERVMNGELGQIIRTGLLPTALSGFPPHVDEALGRIENLVSEEEELENRDTYYETMKTLKRCYNGARNAALKAPDSPFMLAWCAMVKPHYIELLSAHRPIALVLLMHLAILFRITNHIWWVGDWGMQILRAAEAYLPPGWHHWVEFPRAMILCGEDMWKFEEFEAKRQAAMISTVIQ